MKNIYNLDLYFNSIKYHIYYFDVLIKKTYITKEALLKELDIPYMTYKRAKEYDSKAGFKMVNKLDDYFNICPLDDSKKLEYEETLNNLINRFYYRSANIRELEPKIAEYISENNYLKPLFMLMQLVVKLVKVKNLKKLLEENKEVFEELKLYAKKYFVSPFIELFTFVEILYYENKPYDVEFNKNISEDMKGVLYNGFAANAILSQNYGLCLHYCNECRNHLIKDHNYGRLIFVNLIYFACLNKIGEYKKCFGESRRQLMYLMESMYNEELVKATSLHYYTACLGLNDFVEIINSINNKQIFSSNDYIFILLASYKYDKKIFQKYLSQYIEEEKRFTNKQNEYINLIIMFIKEKNKPLIKDKIIKSELNIGLKEILLTKF